MTVARQPHPTSTGGGFATRGRASVFGLPYSVRRLEPADAHELLEMLAASPYSPSRTGDPRISYTYMFANKNCAACHGFLRRYPDG